jgi:hypothetical protein
MSSSNAVSVSYVDETVYGTTPTVNGSTEIQQIRFTSESLSGTPITVESANIRTDRMSSGQVAVGLEVGGDISFELSRDAFIDKFLSMGMMGAWQAATSDVSSVSFTLDGSDNQRGVLAGTGVGTGISVADVLKVTVGGVDYVFQVVAVTSSDELDVGCKKNQADFTGGTSRRPAYLDIDSVQQSVTLSKAYEDVLDSSDDEYSQAYSGTIVSGFSVNVEYGSIVSGTFSLSANGYEQEKPSLQQRVVTAGGTVNPAPTSQPVNASVDVPIVSTENLPTNFCITSFSITLSNGLTPQNCIGKAAPTRYELGTSAISIEAGAYLSATAYEALMGKKVTQEGVPMTFIIQNSDGGYAFAFPAIQLSFPDPGASGANQQVMIDGSGTAKVGDNGESQLRIYQI